MNTIAETRDDLVYAIGICGFRYPSAVRENSLVDRLRQVNPLAAGKIPPISDTVMSDFLTATAHGEPSPSQWGEHLPVAEDVIWILQQETTPIYALKPEGPFAVWIYAKLAAALRPNAEHWHYHIAVAGRLSGSSVKLSGGKELPVLVPNYRSMFSMGLKFELRAKREPTSSAAFISFAKDAYGYVINPGDFPKRRAENYALSIFLQATLSEGAIRPLVQNEYRISEIAAKPAPNAPDGTLWDVTISLKSANSQNKGEWRGTIETSDICPMIVGRPSFNSPVLGVTK
jgi:hypothetical protein